MRKPQGKLNATFFSARGACFCGLGGELGGGVTSFLSCELDRILSIFECVGYWKDGAVCLYAMVVLCRLDARISKTCASMKISLTGLLEENAEICHVRIHEKYLYTSRSIQLPNAKSNMKVS
jgi:hypothetical protein